MGCPVETNPWTKVVRVLVPPTMQERQQNWVGLAVVANIVGVRVELVAEAHIQRELRMQVPIILEISRNEIIVGVRNDQRPGWHRAADGRGKEEVLIVD